MCAWRWNMWSRGEAPFGIVYATDAKVAPVQVVGAFPENSHPPIVYPVALTRTRFAGGARVSRPFCQARRHARFSRKRAFRILN